jgi:hypothetical protein
MTADRGSRVTAEEGRPSAWSTRPASLAELADNARTGPTVTHVVDGKPVTEDVDWPGALVWAWKVWAWLAVAVGGAAYGVVWAVQKPGRTIGLAVLLAVVWALAKGGAA